MCRLLLCRRFGGIAPLLLLCGAAVVTAAAPRPAAFGLSAASYWQQRRCPRCKVKAKPAALFCGSCGLKLPLSPAQLARAASAARLTLDRGRYMETAQRARKLLAENRNYAPARALLGNALVELGKLEAGKTELQTALRLDPGSSLSYTGLGTLYQKQNDTEGATRAFLRAVMLNRRDPRPAAKLKALEAKTAASAVSRPTETPVITPESVPADAAADTSPGRENSIIAEMLKVRVSLRNYIRNDGFEATGRGGQAKEWKFSDASTLENKKPRKGEIAPPPTAYRGKNAARIARSLGYIEAKFDRAEITENHAFALTLYARRESDTAPANARVELQWKDRDGETLETWLSPDFTPSSENWEPFGYLRRAPLGAAGYAVKITVTSPTAGDKGLLFDDIGLFDADPFAPRTPVK